MLSYVNKNVLFFGEFLPFIVKGHETSRLQEREGANERQNFGVFLKNDDFHTQK